MNCIKIVDWNKYFENNRTRELKHMAWIPVPNKMDGTGYTALLDHPNGAAHLGAWLALLEVASRCDVRGTLSRDGAGAMDEATLERITRVRATVWKEALPRLASIGWITGYGKYRTIPQEGAVKCPSSGTELNGTELNGTSTLSASPTTQYSEIIARLNQEAHTSFRASSAATQKIIKARMNEGFTVNDFCTVIEFKCRQWLTDPQMMQFLRPSTLFSPKFEGYLQAAKSSKVVAEAAERKRRVPLCPDCKAKMSTRICTECGCSLIDEHGKQIREAIYE